MAFVVGAWFFVPRSRITQANFDRIETGMTQEEVTAVLGPPNLGLTLGSFRPVAAWADGPDVITVTMDEDGRVSDKEYTAPTPWRRLRWHVNEWLVKLGIGGDPLPPDWGP
jgi:hypothetical protein